MDRHLDAHLSASRIDNDICARPQLALHHHPARALLWTLLPAAKRRRRRILQRELQPLLVDINAHNLGRPKRPRHGTAQQPHRPGPEHHDAIPGPDGALLADMHGDGRRLDQRALLKAHVGGKDVAVVLGQRVVACQRAVVGRSCRERHVGAEVVFPFLAARAAPAGNPWLHGDAVADFEGLDG